RHWSGTEFAEAHYDQVTVAGRPYLAIYGKTDRGDALLLAKPDPLDNVFDLGSGESGLMAALVRRGGEVVVARKGGEVGTSWLPASEAVPEEKTHWSGPSRAGPERT